MKKKLSYNILIALNSFKDVYSQKESIKLIGTILTTINKNENRIFNIKSVILADGGEFSHEVVKNNLNCQEIEVFNVINPFKQKVISSYLILEDNSAFISSSHILRILSKDERYKNPLHLTSYGLGQLINHALKKGIKKIFLGLGGTNTIDAGIGMLQALGVRFKDQNNLEITPSDKKYFSGCDLSTIQYIECLNIESFKNIEVIALCDGAISIDEMNTPNCQKIGKTFQIEKDEILNRIENGLQQYSRINNMELSKKYLGVAGGINLSLSYLFKLNMKLGIDYFVEKLNIEEKIKSSDLIITGEGKFDNSFAGKTPVGISKIAKKYNKQVLYLVGDVENKYKKLFDDDLAVNLPEYIQQYGITSIASCHFFNNKMNKQSLDLGDYKKNTPIVFERAIKQYLLLKGFIK